MRLLLRHPALLTTAAACVLVSLLLALLLHDGPLAIGLVLYSPIAAPLLMAALFLLREVGVFSDFVGERIEDAMLARRRCPVCSYELAGLEPEADGCVVCPECAAAWRAVRVGAVAKPPADVVVVTGFVPPLPDVYAGPGALPAMNKAAAADDRVDP